VSTAARATELAQLREGAAALGCPLDATQGEALLRLLDELAQWNRAYNLTAITDRSQMLTHHLLDSLAVWPALAGVRVLDLGTGAGFPGLPLALVDPQRRFTLLDGTAKKIRFVAHAARTLGLANVTAVHGRAGEWQPEALFDTVVARAVAPLPKLAALARPLLAPGGRLVACKGQRREAEAELAAMAAAMAASPRAAAASAWLPARIEEVAVPGLGAGRCLVTLVAASASSSGAPGATPAG
jgi:16S rRNA (guanine527-N7)-methyltransferase